MTTNPVTFILAIGVSLYAARWLWRRGGMGLEMRDRGEGQENV